MKRIILSLLVILVFALAIVSPYGITPAMEGLNAVERSLTEYKNTVSQINQSVTAINRARDSFDESRSFEVYYGDVDRLLDVLDNVSGITVQRVECVNAKNDFVPTVDYKRGSGDVSGTSAIRITLIVDDTTLTLTRLDKMELPVHDVYVQEPGSVRVTFLTGGGLSE